MRMENIGRQQNGSGASAENRLAGAKVPYWFEQVFFAQQFQHGSAFAARNDEPINAIQIVPGSDLDNIGASARESACVSFKITLQRKDTDEGLPLDHGY
jgi:hypothetical protein